MRTEQVYSSDNYYDGGSAFYSQTGSRLPEGTFHASSCLYGSFPEAMTTTKVEQWDSFDATNESGPYDWQPFSRQCDGNYSLDVARQGLPFGSPGLSLNFPDSSSDSAASGRSMDQVDLDRYSEELVKYLGRNRNSCINMQHSNENISSFETEVAAANNTERQSRTSNIFTGSIEALTTATLKDNSMRNFVPLSSINCQAKCLGEAKLALDYDSILDAWDYGQALRQCDVKVGGCSSDEHDLDGITLRQNSQSVLSSMHISSYAPGKANRLGSHMDSPRPRWLQLSRYREKKNRRGSNPRVRYGLRKANADNRPRIKGRFVKGLGPGDAPS
jgi:hypothetical protein